MFITFKDSQPLNAWSPIFLSVLGNCISNNPLKSKKALSPIAITPSGTLTLKISVSEQPITVLSLIIKLSY